MTDKITAMFQDVTMPEHCEAAIRQAAAAKAAEAAPSPRRRFHPAAIAAALALVLFLSPTVRAAAAQWAETHSFPDLDLTIFESKDQSGETTQVALVHTERPTFAHLQDGRLYFTGNGQNLDITDHIREDQPFFYQYTDKNTGMTVHLAVGIRDSLESFGVYEFIQDPQGQWVTGTGRNFLYQDNEKYLVCPWVEIVWETLDIPWPLPGDPSETYDVAITENSGGETSQISVDKKD